MRCRISARCHAARKLWPQPSRIGPAPVPCIGASTAPGSNLRGQVTGLPGSPGLPNPGLPSPGNRCPYGECRHAPQGGARSIRRSMPIRRRSGPKPGARARTEILRATRHPGGTLAAPSGDTIRPNHLAVLARLPPTQPARDMSRTRNRSGGSVSRRLSAGPQAARRASSRAISTDRSQSFRSGRSRGLPDPWRSPAHALNRFTALGTPQIHRVASVRSTERKTRPQADLCNRAEYHRR